MQLLGALVGSLLAAAVVAGLQPTLLVTLERAPLVVMVM
jgi:hypothetical protein